VKPGLRRASAGASSSGQIPGSSEAAAGKSWMPKTRWCP